MNKCDNISQIHIYRLSISTMFSSVYTTDIDYFASDIDLKKKKIDDQAEAETLSKFQAIKLII